MNTLDDTIFGRLAFDKSWSRSYEVTIFGSRKAVLLIVQTFDGELISDNQRKAFISFEKNQQNIISSVETGVLTYYQDNFNSAASTLADVAELVNLLKIKIMSSDIEGNRFHF